MNNLLIIGAGGHGKVIVESAAAMEKWGKIAFLDDGYETGSECNGYPVLGKLNSCYEFLDTYKDLFIAISENFLREVLIFQILFTQQQLSVIQLKLLMELQLWLILSLIVRL